MKERTQTQATRSLNRKNDVYVSNGIIYLLTGTGKQSRSNDLGNASWANVDYLTNHCNFVQMWMDELPRKRYQNENETIAV